MSNFKSKQKFSKYNDYYTTEDTWRMIEHIIPKNKVIWEACMLNSDKNKSPEILKKITSNIVVYNTKLDMLERRLKCDMIITNIPFETNIKKLILARLVQINKPFIIIMNSCNVFSKYMREIFGKKIKHLQIITPTGHIQYEKLLENGEVELKKGTSFYSCFVAYKMKLKGEQLWV